MSDIVDLLRDVPAPIAASWGAWLAGGLTLLLWHLRARDWEREAALAQASARARSKPGVRPPSGVRRAPKPVAADAFGELEALLEPSSASGGTSRRPGD